MIVNPTILLVDDNEDDRLFTKIQLRDLGCNIIEADSKKSALEKLDKADLLIIDMRLPNGTANDIIQELENRNLLTPVIILSGYPEYGINYDELDTVKFMVKPFELKSFSDKLNETLRLLEIMKNVRELKIRVDNALSTKGESNEFRDQ